MSSSSDDDQYDAAGYSGDDGSVDARSSASGSSSDGGAYDTIAAYPGEDSDAAASFDGNEDSTGDECDVSAVGDPALRSASGAILTHQSLSLYPGAVPLAPEADSSSSGSDLDSSDGGDDPDDPRGFPRERDVVMHRAAAAPRRSPARGEPFTYPAAVKPVRVTANATATRGRSRTAKDSTKGGASNKGSSKSSSSSIAVSSATPGALANAIAPVGAIEPSARRPGCFEALPATVSDYTPLSFELDGVPVLTPLPVSPSTTRPGAVPSAAHAADLAALATRLAALGVPASAAAVVAAAPATWGAGWAHAVPPGAAWLPLAHKKRVPALGELDSSSTASTASSTADNAASTEEEAEAREKAAVAMSLALTRPTPAASGFSSTNANTSDSASASAGQVVTADSEAAVALLPAATLQEWARAAQAARAACAVEQLLASDGWDSDTDAGFDRLFYSTLSPRVLPRPPRRFVDAVHSGGPEDDVPVIAGAPPHWRAVGDAYYYAPPHPLADPAFGAAPPSVLAWGAGRTVRRLAALGGVSDDAAAATARLEQLAADAAATGADPAALADIAEEVDAALASSAAAATAAVEALKLEGDDAAAARAMGVHAGAAARALAWLRGAGITRGRKGPGLSARAPTMEDVPAPPPTAGTVVAQDAAGEAELRLQAVRLPRAHVLPVEARVAPYFRSAAPTLCYFNLPVLLPFPFCTGLEPDKEIPLEPGTRVAARYRIIRSIGVAAFSRAVEVVDELTGQTLCLKVMRNEKDLLDQCLDEVKVLQLLNSHDPRDLFHIIRMRSTFYVQEHMCVATELLGLNLHDASKVASDPEAPAKAAELQGSSYFSLRAIRKIARQLLISLWYLRCFGVLHGDIKPENVLIQDWATTRIKLIDFGSACFLHGALPTYAQSRSYRAPEVILGLPYDTPSAVDMWSLGCLLYELYTNQLLFSNRSLPIILARMESLLGPVPPAMVEASRYAERYYRIVPMGKGRLFQLFQWRSVESPALSRNRDYEGNTDPLGGEDDDDDEDAELVAAASAAIADAGLATEADIAAGGADPVSAYLPPVAVSDPVDLGFQAETQTQAGPGSALTAAAGKGQGQEQGQMVVVEDAEGDDAHGLAAWQRPDCGLAAAVATNAAAQQACTRVLARAAAKEEPKWAVLDTLVGARPDDLDPTPQGAENMEEAFLDVRPSSLLQRVLVRARKQRAAAIEAAASGEPLVRDTNSGANSSSSGSRARRSGNGNGSDEEKSGDARSATARKRSPTTGTNDDEDGDDGLDNDDDGSNGSSSSASNYSRETVWTEDKLADASLDPAWALATCHPTKWPGRKLRPQPWEADTPRRVHEFMMRRAKTAGVPDATDAAFPGNPAAPRPKFFGAHHPAQQPPHESPALFANFLSQLLRFDPHERPSPEQALLHPFLWPVHDEEEWDL